MDYLSFQIIELISIYLNYISILVLIFGNIDYHFTDHERTKATQPHEIISSHGVARGKLCRVLVVL